jgi:hypothetical protein
MVNTHDLIQLIGYAGSVLVAASLMMSSIVKLRIINLAGAMIFSTYGFLIGALPVGFLNGFISLVDIFYLVQIFSAKEFFRVLELQLNSEYLSYFLNFHEREIKKFIPSFLYQPNENYHAMFVLRDAMPAGIVIAEYLEDDIIYIRLDFAVPGYRDFKMGKYVFAEIFKKKNVKKIFSDPGNSKHEVYLKRMGFVKTKLNSETVYCLEVK